MCVVCSPWLRASAGFVHCSRGRLPAGITLVAVSLAAGGRQARPRANGTGREHKRLAPQPCHEAGTAGSPPFIPPVLPCGLPLSLRPA